MGVSITVDNVDSDTLGRLQLEAQRRGVDVGAVIKEMIRGGLSPVATSGTVQAHHDLDDLAGTWSAADVQEFRTATEDFRHVDEAVWK
jgi:hypothetical protein